VSDHHFTGEGEAQTHALAQLSRGKEGLEDAVYGFNGHPRTVVQDLDHDPFRTPVYLHAHLGMGAAGHGLTGVDQ
jgi:hypothetical protein